MPLPGTSRGNPAVFRDLEVRKVGWATGVLWTKVIQCCVRTINWPGKTPTYFFRRCECFILIGHGNPSQYNIQLNSWINHVAIKMFPRIGALQNGWFIVSNGKPFWNWWFGGTAMFGNIHINPLQTSDKISRMTPSKLPSVWLKNPFRNYRRQQQKSSWFQWDNIKNLCSTMIPCQFPHVITHILIITNTFSKIITLDHTKPAVIFNLPILFFTKERIKATGRTQR